MCKVTLVFLHIRCGGMKVHVTDEKKKEEKDKKKKRNEVGEEDPCAVNLQLPVFSVLVRDLQQLSLKCDTSGPERFAELGEGGDRKIPLFSEIPYFFTSDTCSALLPVLQYFISRHCCWFSGAILNVSTAK